jgi:Peptidase family C25
VSKDLPPQAGPFALEFVGRFPRGKKTRQDEFNLRSVYRLDRTAEGTTPARFRSVAAPAGTALGLARSELRTHYEVNRKLMRFSGNQTPDEVWFWEVVMASDKTPKRVPIRAERVSLGRPARLRVRLFGYSSMPKDPDHYVDVTWNGVALPQAVWDGQTPFTYERSLPAGSVREGVNTLGLRVDGVKTDGLDVVLLDWVQIDYTQQLQVRNSRQQLPFSAKSGTRVQIDALAPARVTIYDGEQGVVQEAGAARRFTRFEPPAEIATASADDNRFWAVRDGGWLAPAAITVSKLEDLKAPGLAADFVIVTDREFFPPAERLAAQRRQEGLRTVVVDVNDVYDNFSGGFLDPEAIKAFLAYAYAEWQPKLRYVLLFGDASWDYTNRSVDDQDYPDHLFLPEAWTVTIPKIASAPLRPGDRRNDRQRVPTFQWQSPWGHAASDNYFACVSGNDEIPDLALGRLTVGTLDEAEAAVNKILAYGQGYEGPSEGALFITDQYDYHKTQSDRVAKLAEERGYAVTKVYPRAEEKDNAGNSTAIKAAFDSGQSVVVFAGHGGRYIWQTGPPDPIKNHDLFTLRHLDELQPTAQLPIVVSLTCYSAPFDHPTADSIGEKLMRLEHKGAIAILASSWRNVPPFALAQYLMEDLGTPDKPRLGDAFVDAMRRVGQSDSLNTYNLLGDPTLPVKAPSRPAHAAVIVAPPRATPWW